MRKGFTLIELLAVIVILAIIALIATPIILGIINDAKEDSNKRSIENYAHAVELAVARYASSHNGVIPFGEYEANGKTLTNKDTTATPQTIEVDYKGEKITGTVIVLDEDGKEGQIVLEDIKINEGKTAYNYSEENGVEKVKEKEISEEKELSVLFLLTNAMYNETQTGFIGSYQDDENNDKVSDLNSELSAYLGRVEFNIPTSEFTEAAPTLGDIKAKVMYHDGREEEITLTTADNEVWRYKYVINTIGESWEKEIEFSPNTRYNESHFYEDFGYHYLNPGYGYGLPFIKITILGKTIEFPTNNQAMIVDANMNTGEFKNLYNDINKVNKIIVNFKDKTKKEYKRNDMHNADDYLGDDLYSSPSIPILYTTDEYSILPGIKAFIINMPTTSAQIESVIIEEDGILKKYNVTDKTILTNFFIGS